ncbi:hypothetical protein KP509_14G082500 [Ceratopteris richardii]|uniref:Uncharacterized protein n=1 Tax=Ceratopteris richardii TaxID=49495 RepID=A0A8T2T9Q7_CERRI|nr:hypothetical protein KP509_14G082500 [Ceratopteris richardii]
MEGYFAAMAFRILLHRRMRMLSSLEVSRKHRDLRFSNMSSYVNMTLYDALKMLRATLIYTTMATRPHFSFPLFRFIFREKKKTNKGSGPLPQRRVPLMYVTFLKEADSV